MKTFKMIASVAIVALAGAGVYASVDNNQFSDLQMENVEALTQEGGQWQKGKIPYLYWVPSSATVSGSVGGSYSGGKGGVNANVGGSYSVKPVVCCKSTDLDNYCDASYEVVECFTMVVH